MTTAITKRIAPVVRKCATCDHVIYERQNSGMITIKCKYTQEAKNGFDKCGGWEKRG